MKTYLLGLSLVTMVACGGIAVIDGDGSGGASASSSSANTAVTTSTSGGGPCATHEDCPGALCIFATGQCAEACTVNDCSSCPTGEICSECATSSCPNCLDCVSACVPAPAGQCDAHDDCASDEVCIFSTGMCRHTCDTFNCTDAQFCMECATSSGPCDDDCVEACSP